MVLPGVLQSWSCHGLALCASVMVLPGVSVMVLPCALRSWSVMVLPGVFQSWSCHGLALCASVMVLPGVFQSWSCHGLALCAPVMVFPCVLQSCTDMRLALCASVMVLPCVLQSLSDVRLALCASVMVWRASCPVCFSHGLRGLALCASVMVWPASCPVCFSHGLALCASVMNWRASCSVAHTMTNDRVHTDISVLLRPTKQQWAQIALVPNSPYGLCGRKATLNLNWSATAQELCESRGGRPGLQTLTVLMVSVDVKQDWNENEGPT